MIFSTSTNTNMLSPLPSSSSSALLLQTVARICRDRLVQITAVCLNTLWLEMEEKTTFWRTRTAIHNFSPSLAFIFLVNIKLLNNLFPSTTKEAFFFSTYHFDRMLNNHAAMGRHCSNRFLSSSKYQKKVQKLPWQKKYFVNISYKISGIMKANRRLLAEGCNLTCFGNTVFQQVNHKRPTSESHLLHKHLLKHHHIQQILMNWELSKGTFTWVVVWFSRTCCWSALDSLQLTLLWFTGWKSLRSQAHLLSLRTSLKNNVSLWLELKSMGLELT